MAINATHKNIYFFGFKLSKNVDSNSIHLQIHESLLALNERLLLKSPTCWGLTAARFIKVLLQIYAVCYRIIDWLDWLIPITLKSRFVLSMRYSSFSIF